MRPSIRHALLALVAINLCTAGNAAAGLVNTPAITVLSPPPGDQFTSQRDQDVAERFWRRTNHEHTIYLWPTGGFGNMMRSVGA